MAVDKNQFEGESSVLRFYRTVLTWDYLRILKESEKKGKGTSVGLKKVKDTYKDVDDYLSTFEPLLFEEVKAQIAQGRSDEENAGEFAAVINKCTETDGFHLVTIIHEVAQSVSQNDLILISRTKLGDGKLPTKYAFALVEHCRSNGEQEQVELRMHLKGEVKRPNGKEFEPSPRLLNMCSLVSEVNSSSQHVLVYILKICSLSTIAREYVALRSISSLPFKDLVLAAKESNYSCEDRKWELPRALMESLESNHNESQMDSIRVGLSRKRFVLIQGPPGTGKTQTILGLLSAVLHATPARVSSKDKTLGIKRGPDLPINEKYNHWQKAAPWLNGINPRDAIMPVGGDDGFFPTSGNDLRPEVVSSSRKHRVRVLVCAPSNSALDEIVLRLLNTGIRDENDRVYNPKIVRIGLKPHHSVHTVSMDYLMEQKKAGMDFKGSDKNKQGGGGSERDSLRASILEEAAIVFSTLSFSGSPLFSKLNRGFDVVIIDEAAQATELPGIVRDWGYVCGCSSCNFSRILSAYEFEMHAGGSTKHPNNHIFLENGRPIYAIIQELKTAPLDMVDEVIKRVAGSAVNEEIFGAWRVRIKQKTEMVKAENCEERRWMTKFKKPFSHYPSSSSYKKKSIFGNRRRDNDLHRVLFMPDGLPDGAELAYYAKGQKVLGGYKQGNGIVCSCC